MAAGRAISANIRSAVDMTDVLDKLLDLHKQATTERSHYYVASIVKTAALEIIALRQLVSDHEDVHKDHKRLVRELDVLLNGEDGAAKQASLCDIVGQLKSPRRKSLTQI